jgi:TatA/E family protein of Tat protein translocase
MFGIGGGEFLLIILVVLMLFGSDKIPEIARTVGKVIKQLKHATEDIKNEIQKSAGENGLNSTDLTSGITDEIQKNQTRCCGYCKTKRSRVSTKSRVRKNQRRFRSINRPNQKTILVWKK